MFHEPNLIKMKKLITLLALIATMAIFAQAPQGFNYQATVRSSSGQLLLSQIVLVKFNILQNSATGDIVYSETQTANTDDLGQINLVVGQGTAPTGTFSTINWGGGSYFLGIELNSGNGYVAMGTTQLLSVPYALYATNGISPTQATAITAMQAQIASLQAQLSVLQKPQINTTPIENLTFYSATLGGAITYTGLGNITARGVVWNTSTAPTIELATKTFDGTGSGEFGSNITGLTPETTYYVRAYSTNSFGTAYGNEVIFTTLSTPVTPAEVTIGTQTWTTKNLDVATYSDGTLIPQVTDPTAWAALTTGAWCYYNNTTANGTTYGKLYNWYAVAGIHDTDPNTPNKKLAPTGYHVPTDAEWTTLTTFLEGEAVAGGKMKATGISLWSGPNTGATNSSGFTGLPGGARNNFGTFYLVGYDGYWWSSSEFNTNTTYAWYRSLFHTSGNAYRTGSYKKDGFSVRCLRD
jgi:uncharacterized protein (TIGR02145 family)